MRILGIDPGTATVGWAVIDLTAGKIGIVDFGHISTSPKTPMTERLLEISKDLEEIITKYEPEEAGVEELFFAKNVKTAMTVSQARGAILLTLERFCVNIFEYKPNEIKLSLTGYGRADKPQMQEMVKAILKLKSIPKPDDAADACAIAICHANSRKMKTLQASK
ncbi:MAG: crossover junction endodeoxyribonuclease RuvC [Candidatus Moraniibacteriota bacterium]